MAKVVALLSGGDSCERDAELIGFRRGFLGGTGGIACLALAVAIIFSQQGHEPETKPVAKKRKPPIVQQVEPQERAPVVRQPKEADLKLIARYRRELKDIQNGIEATKERMATTRKLRAIRAADGTPPTLAELQENTRRLNQGDPEMKAYAAKLSSLQDRESELELLIEKASR